MDAGSKTVSVSGVVAGDPPETSIVADAGTTVPNTFALTLSVVSALGSVKVCDACPLAFVDNVTGVSDPTWKVTAMPGAGVVPRWTVAVTVCELPLCLRSLLVRV